MDALPGTETLDNLQLDLIPAPTQTDNNMDQASAHPSQPTDASVSSNMNQHQSSDPPSSSHQSQSGDDQSAPNRQEGGSNSDNNMNNTTIEPSDSIDSSSISSSPSEASEGAATGASAPTLESSESNLQEQEAPAHETGNRRSTRVRKPVERLTSSKLGELSSKAMLATLNSITSFLTSTVQAP